MDIGHRSLTSALRGAPVVDLEPRSLNWIGTCAISPLTPLSAVLRRSGYVRNVSSTAPSGFDRVVRCDSVGGNLVSPPCDDGRLGMPPQPPRLRWLPLPDVADKEPSSSLLANDVCTTSSTS